MSNQKLSNIFIACCSYKHGAQWCRLNKVFKGNKERILDMGENFSDMENAFDKKWKLLFDQI